MSIPSQKVAPLLGATEAIVVSAPVAEVVELSVPVVNKKRRRKRVYKARVATKIKWALGDTMEKTISAQSTMRLVLKWLEEQWSIDAGNHARLVRLGQLDHLLAGLALDVSDMERIVTRALEESDLKSSETGQGSH